MNTQNQTDILQSREQKINRLMNSIDSQNLEDQPKIIPLLWDELDYLRKRPLSKQKEEKMHQINRPVAMFSKPERLRNEMGTEITLIFRSSACRWAGSKSGGCTMCGYWNDRADSDITGENYWNQFSTAIDKYSDILVDSNQKIVFKMFTSGSFCDPQEVAKDTQLKILNTLASYPSIKEIVIESRPEYLQDDLLAEYASILSHQYLEVGVGLETSSDYIRTNVINKGFSWSAFKQAVNRLHTHHFGVKAYLIFKPPFIPEYAAIVDIFNSIRECIHLQVDTISINPTNIQQNTICDVLQSQNQFRSPWLFSLLWVIKNAVVQAELSHTRIICDPSAAGKDRGVHNFTPYHPSNEECLNILQNFVHSQDLSRIPNEIFTEWLQEYRSELFFRKL